MEKYQNRVCSVCGNHVVLNAESHSIPIFQEESAICHECSEKGYRFCEQCHEPFNHNEVDYKKFNHIYTLFKWRELFPQGKYCSNECYNIALIDEEIAYQNLLIFEVETIRVHEDKSEDEKEFIVNNAQDRIKELEGFKKHLESLRV